MDDMKDLLELEGITEETLINLTGNKGGEKDEG